MLYVAAGVDRSMSTWHLCSPVKVQFLLRATQRRYCVVNLATAPWTSFQAAFPHVSKRWDPKDNINPICVKFSSHGVRFGTYGTQLSWTTSGEQAQGESVCREISRRRLVGLQEYFILVTIMTTQRWRSAGHLLISRSAAGARPRLETGNKCLLGRAEGTGNRAQAGRPGPHTRSNLHNIFFHISDSTSTSSMATRPAVGPVAVFSFTLMALTSILTDF